MKTISGNGYSASGTEDSPVELVIANGTDERRTGLARLACAAFFIGAIALVNPALADECDQMAELVRAAAGDDTVPSDKMHTVGHTIESALNHQASGNDKACRMHLTLAREMLTIR